MTSPTDNSCLKMMTFLIEQSVHEATKKNGLIDFTKLVRNYPENDFQGKYSVKLKELERMFSLDLWSEHKTKSGHRKLTHKLTNVVVEYSNHEKNDDVDPGAALTILDQVQEHINRLFNDIVVYPKLYKYDGGYLKKPSIDVSKSAKQYINMKEKKESKEHKAETN